MKWNVRPPSVLDTQYGRACPLDRLFVPVTDFYPSRQTLVPATMLRRDLVVYSSWTPSAPLSREQTEQFDRDGYLVLEDVFSRAEVEALSGEAARLRACPAELEAETIITERGSGEVRSIFAIHAQNTMLARLAADARMAGVARFLLGEDVYIHQSRLNYKPGFEGKEFFWHSDFETWHVEDGMPRMRALSMSILLTENTAHNGPLMVIPGSHKSFVSCVGETPPDHFKTSLKKQEYGVPDRACVQTLVETHGIDAALGKPGAVIVFDCNVMHGSNGNITPQPRSNAFLVYNALSNRLAVPFGPLKQRPAFIATRDPVAVIPRRAGLKEDAA
jgi:ectoine hydroxylase